MILKYGLRVMQDDLKLYDWNQIYKVEIQLKLSTKNNLN